MSYGFINSGAIFYNFLITTRELSPDKRITLEMINNQKKLILVASLICIFFVGCSTISEPKKLSSAWPKALADKGWWQVRFQINWPQKTEPVWHADLLLAREIISPLLSEAAEDITLWRFHRRAARDLAGHQFSLLIYTTPKLADRISDELKSDLLLADLVKQGVIKKITYSRTNKINLPQIQDTCDKRWSLPLQKAWPYYIMGVSQMWLEMIEELSEKEIIKKNPDTVDDYLCYYRKINIQLTDIWQNQGYSAFLHHLNAIFGYQPVMVYNDQLMRF